MQGSAGNDLLYGGDAGDRVQGGTENDTIYGDSGDDYVLLYLSPASSTMTIYGGVFVRPRRTVQTSPFGASKVAMDG